MTADTDKRDRREGCVVVLVMLGVVAVLWAGGLEPIAFPAAAMATCLVLAVQMHPECRDKRWFWVLLAVMAAADIVVLLSFQWPPNLGRGRGKLEGVIVMAGAITAFEILFHIVRRLTEGRREPVQCRACGKEVGKTTIRCPACGEWKPGPLPAWPWVIVLAPWVIILVGSIFTVDWFGPEEVPMASDYAKYAPGAEIRDPLNRSVARTLLREKDIDCSQMVSIRAVGPKQWDVRCGQAHGHGAYPTRRYAVYPKTGVVKACPPDAESPCP